MALIWFLIEAFIISFSGAMQPGPVTATAIIAGAKNRHAGFLLAIGHGVIEFPLMIVIMMGMGRFFELAHTKIIIGFVGGVVLVIMGFQILTNVRRSHQTDKAIDKKPVLAGVILSASNPYFLLWWATIGLALITDVQDFGIWAFGIFAVVHWLSDLIWFEALSLASFKGSVLLGGKGRTYVFIFCAVAMFFFGAKFIYDSASVLASTL